MFHEFGGWRESKQCHTRLLAMMSQHGREREGTNIWLNSIAFILMKTNWDPSRATPIPPRAASQMLYLPSMAPHLKWDQTSAHEPWGSCNRSPQIECFKMSKNSCLMVLEAEKFMTDGFVSDEFYCCVIPWWKKGTEIGPFKRSN